MTARIADFRFHVACVPIHVPFAISKETLLEAKVVIVQCIDEHGLVGLGEGAPFPSLTGDTAEQVYNTAKGFSSELHATTVDNAFKELRQNRGGAFKDTPTAYAAIEMALWDLKARQQNCSLAKLWGNAHRKGVATDITLPIMPPHEIENFWRIFSSHSFPIIKVKVSGRPQDDVTMIKTLLELAPLPKPAITLDGNQGFDVRRALQLVDELAVLNLKPLFFEQPLPEDDWKGLADLSRRCSVPVMLDETIKSVTDVMRAVNDRVAPMLNLKITKSGIQDTLDIIEVASKAGIEMMIGGMLESEIAMGTSLQMLCGTGKIKYADLDTPFFMTRRLTKYSPWHHPHAFLSCPTGTGHGLELSAQAEELFQTR